MQRKEGFDAVISLLKKIVLRSNMHGGLLIEQMLRVYFFERRELQNLCLIIKNSQNEMLLDTYSSKTLDSLLQFVVEATEVMA